MLGDFINRGLVMVLGYAYPAFECFKTVEKNKVDITELRFWCQYWMIMAALSVFERFGDLFISWVPFYGEMKLAFIIYLWSPKTKGTTVVYDSVFKPLIAKHETDIDRRIEELKLRAWDLALYYWQNFAHVGHSAFLNMVQYVLQQSYKMKSLHTENHQPKAASPPSTPVAVVAARRQQPVADSTTAMPRNMSKRWPPVEESNVRSSFNAQAQAQTKAQKELDDSQSEYVHVDEMPESPGSSPKREKTKFGPVGSIKRRAQPTQ